MSFSADVKSELCRIPVERGCCALAESYGVLLFANTFNPREIRIITGNPGFSARLPKLFERAFEFGFDSSGNGDDNTGRRKFIVRESEKIEKIYKAYGYEPESILAHHINLGVLEEDCCRASFMRGAFLAGGSVTDPKGRYHLELVTGHRSVSKEIYAILLDMGFSPKQTSRGGNYITYFKLSEAVEDFLTTIGAPISSMEIMSEKVLKDMRNAVNRRVNCDSANADKIVAASREQLGVIRRIDRESGLENLPERLRETALLRIANPEASLSDLALLADPPVSKSCLSHRLRKLMEYEGKG